MIHGKFTVTVNGKSFKTQAGASFDPGGLTRESKSGDQGYAGKTSTYRGSKMTCTVIFGGDDQMSDYDFDGGTMMVESDSGRTWVVADAGVTGERTLGTDGLALTIEGAEAEEMS